MIYLLKLGDDMARISWGSGLINIYLGASWILVDVASRSRLLLLPGAYRCVAACCEKIMILPIVWRLGLGEDDRVNTQYVFHRWL